MQRGRRIFIRPGIAPPNSPYRDHATYKLFRELVKSWVHSASVRLVLVLLLIVSPYSLHAETVRKVYFKGTDLELDVITIKGRVPGPTLLILGGIQGDEPGGYLAADLYADLTLKKGNLIVVPRANFLSIVENRRGVQGDMNRKFAGSTKASDRDLEIVAIIKNLMRKSDFFLNLHDGSGFYRSKWESPLRNPRRYGQSIIVDTEEFVGPDGKVIHMGRMVRRVLEKVNPQISSEDHFFHLNNHRTLKKDTKHKEQRRSATFHALTKVGISAFGIETSKSIADYRLRVRYQTMVVNAFLEEMGISSGQSQVVSPESPVEVPYRFHQRQNTDSCDWTGRTQST